MCTQKEKCFIHMIKHSKTLANDSIHHNNLITSAELLADQIRSPRHRLSPTSVGIQGFLDLNYPCPSL